MAQPRFNVGDPVSYPADVDDRFEAGKGKVQKVHPETKWSGFGYDVESEQDGLLPVTFEEKDLAAA